MCAQRGFDHAEDFCRRRIAARGNGTPDQVPVAVASNLRPRGRREFSVRRLPKYRAAVWHRPSAPIARARAWPSCAESRGRCRARYRIGLKSTYWTADSAAPGGRPGPAPLRLDTALVVLVSSERFEKAQAAIARAKNSAAARMARAAKQSRPAAPRHCRAVEDAAADLVRQSALRPDLAQIDGFQAIGTSR